MPLTRRSATNLMLIYGAFALVATFARMSIRKVRNWGRDDALAVIATLSLVAQGTMMSMKERGVHAANNGPGTAATIYYINNSLFYTQDWAARLSILFSILRVCPTRGTVYTLRAMAIVFFCTWVTLLGLLIGYCKKTEYEWSRRTPLAVCKLHQSIIYLQLAVAVASDVVLIAVPFRILRLLTTYPRLVVRLKIIFSMTLLLTAATATQTGITLTGAGRAGTNGLVAATTETFVAILVCNLAIIVTGIIQLLRRNEDEKRQRVVGSSIVFASAHTTEDQSGDAGSLRFNSQTDSGMEGPTRTWLERWHQLDVDEGVEEERLAAAAAASGSASTSIPLADTKLQVSDTQSEKSRSVNNKRSSFFADKDQTKTV